MKKILYLMLMLSSLGAHAFDLPNVSVKDRLRLELWSFGMEKVAQGSNQQISSRPELRPEIQKPLRDLVLEL